MKKIYLSIYLLFLSLSINAQFAVSTNHVSNNGQIGITFNVENTKTSTITITSVSTVHNANTNTSSTLQVWYKKSPITAAPGAISTANGWILAGTKTFPSTSNTIPSVVNCITIDIPADTTYGFWIGGSTGTNPIIGYMTLAAGVNTFSSNGVNLLTGTGIGFGGVQTGPANTPRGYVGGITFTTLDTCNGKPTAGVITGDVGFCTTATHCYSLSGATGNSTGITYQWQESASATGPFTNVGTSALSYSKTISSTTYFRCIVSCSYSGLSDTTPIFIDSQRIVLCYCGSGATNTADTKIDSVIFSTTRSGSAATNCEVYTDYSYLPAPVVRRNQVFTVTIQNGSCSGNHFTSYGKVYVDWNQNRTFDAAEASPGYGPTTGLGQLNVQTLTVPATAPKGLTILRALHYEGGTITAPCLTRSYGETEDYSIYVLVLDYDAEMLSINNQDGCSKADEPISFTVKNFGIKTILNPSFSYSVNGGAAVTQVFTDSIPPDSTRIFTFSSNAGVGAHGTYNLTVWHNNILDSFKSNDTITAILNNYYTPTNLIGKNDTVCVGSLSATLSAVSDAQSETRWYVDTQTTKYISSGNNFILNNPTKDTTFFAKSVYTSNIKAGLPNVVNEFSITNNNNGINFDVLSSELTINSVKLSFGATGIGGIEIRDNLNNTIKSISFVISNVGDMVVPINCILTQGVNYKILLTVNPGLVYGTNNFNGFPLTTNNVIKLNSSTIAGKYCIFYDWDISFVACQSDVIPVKVVYMSTVPNPIGVLAPDIDTCPYPALVLDAGNAGSSYQWSTGETTQTIVASTPGDYFVTVTNYLGCNVRDTANVFFKPTPTLNLDPSYTACSNIGANIASGYSNKGYNHVWSNGDLNSFTNIKTPGTYTLELLNSESNCGTSDTFDVYINPEPTFSLGRDTFTCSQSTVNLKGPSGGYTYIWHNGAKSNSVNITSTTKAYLEITDISTGCKSSDSINVTIATVQKPNLGSDKVSCSDYETIGVTSDSKNSYKWNTGDNLSKINVTKAGTYILTVTEIGTNCSYADSVYLDFIPSPPLNLGTDITTCDTPISLKADDGWTAYNWSNGFTSKGITVNKSGVYSVTVSNGCGTKTDNVTVNFLTPVSVTLPQDQSICEDLTLSIPTQPSGTNVQWSTGEVGNSITVSKSGTYWVSVSNMCGTSSDAINVYRDTIPFVDFEPEITGFFVNFKNLSVNATSFEWDFGNGETSERTNTTQLYDTTKTFTVTLKGYNDCGDEVIATKTITITGIIDTGNGGNGNSSIANAKENDVLVYPNPANSYVTISSTKPIKGSVSLMSVDGKVLMSYDNERINSSGFEIKLDSYPIGTYFIKVESDRESITKKINIIR